MTPVHEMLAAFIARHSPVRRFWVALSGGLDSCVLLHALQQIHPPQSVHIIHVNHQLSANAPQWEDHCRRLAHHYGLPFHTEVVEVERAGTGLERAARDARYRVFEKVVRESDMLLLAHHRDDQAETLLLRLLRGAGQRGMGAMPCVRELGQGQLGRPLLSLSRMELQAYASTHNLQWVEDESNAELEFDRNYLRHSVLPLIAKRWPNYSERFQTTASLVSENELVLQEYAAEDLLRAEQLSERLGHSISLANVVRHSAARRNAVLREWVRQAGFAVPERTQLAHVDDVINAPQDAEPILAWGGAELRRFANRLYLLPRLSSPTQLNIVWHPRDPSALPDGGVLSATAATAGLRADRQYHLRLREGGERCRPHGRTHSQTLKKLLQEYRLEPWLRDRVPLVYCEDQLAAVGDLWVGTDFYVEGSAAWQLQWGYPKERMRQT